MGENICFQNISCSDYNEMLRQEAIQIRYNKPMPYIGAYVAVASLVCFVTMVADMIHGFRNKKFWMPTKYFTINAASLTVLSIAVKLPMDLSMPMETSHDTLARYSGCLFLSTAMANFIPSLGTLNDKELIQNLVALGILVLTLSGNLLVIQSISSVSVSFTISYGVFVFLELSQFVILAFSAIAISTTKKEIELAYHRLKKDVIIFMGDQRVTSFEFEKLKKFVNMYWVISETGNPKFVMSRAVTSSAAAFICVASVIYFVILLFLRHLTSPFGFGSQSDYKWSVCFIFTIQTIGIIVGSIAPALRSLFTILCFCSQTYVCDYRSTFKVERYWTSRLKAWKHRPLALNVRGHTYRKVIQILRNYFYSVCIIIQLTIVVVSKIIRFVSSFFLKLLLNCFYFIGRLKTTIFIKLNISSNSSRSESGSNTELKELKEYVLLLEDEVPLPQSFLKDICKSMNRVIARGVNQQPKMLLKLISEQSFLFKGLTEFDREDVKCLHDEEPPRCWSLSLANLVCIAIVITKEAKIVSPILKEAKISLLQTCAEGVSYLRFVEKGLDTQNLLGSVGNAADILWNGIELNCKWLDTHLINSKTNEGIKGNSKEVLNHFRDVSKNMVLTFKEENKKKNTNSNSLIGNTSTWPFKVIVANSMYRISRSLLKMLEEDKNVTGQYLDDEMVFQRIMTMLAEVLVVCLSNLPRLITSKCLNSSIEKREMSVMEATHLLGATQKILKVVQSQTLPILAPEDAPYMDEWRGLTV